ncbi:proline oxidase-like protein [Boeremia exigua]|uniref:proline oxidase-like protein n=1 Tax=Boeremia exigua TaxID=749465 RepID=UPI001E8D5525|nr:proline oxidase-like protein [Boeremia exigua]KAH6639596.1 proline oxidase-like protein [Boeremia exigua]
MGSRFQQAQRLQRLALAPTPRTLARYVHQSSRHNTAIQSTSSTSTPAQLLSTKTYRQGSTPKSVLARLPTSSVARSYLITAMSSSPALLGLTFTVLRKMLDSKNYLMDVERNPLIRAVLKSTFYAQFCAGDKAHEVKPNLAAARSVLGYDGVIIEYALEVLGGSEPTAAETAAEIEVWRKGMMKSVEMASEGDFIGLKWSGLGRHALHLLQTQQPATPEMWAAITEACDAAAAKGVCLLPGAEEELTNIGLEQWTIALQEKYNTHEYGRALIYTTYQCYLRAVPARIAAHLERAATHNYIAGVKLVRGAYLTSEPAGVCFDTKEGTDACYDACAATVLRRQWSPSIAPTNPSAAFPAVNIVLATHNLASLQSAKAIRAAQLLAAPAHTLPRLAYAQLQGMADEISQSLVQDPTVQADENAQVVKLLAWGTMTECLNFLIRRAAENKEASFRTDDTRRAMGAELGRRLRGFFGLA